jgi:hypothetical protein
MRRNKNLAILISAVHFDHVCWRRQVETETYDIVVEATD